MRMIFVAAILLLLTSVAHATVGETPEEPRPTAEALAMAFSTMSVLGNAMTVAADTPHYWLGGLSVGLGVTALALGAQDDATYRTGLFVAGVAAVGTGLVAMRYRYVLNNRHAEASIVPAWTKGSAAIAVVVVF